MKRTPWLLTCAAILVVAIAAGCKPKTPPSTTPQTPPAPVETPAPTPEPTPAVAEPFPQQPVETAPAEPTIDELNRQGVLRTVYFAYDSNDIDDAAKATLQANARWIAAHPRYTVEIGGHCDERGAIGYNVALGDRRAAAVKSYLATLGADGSKLVSVSYGEEKPADPGHDETAWAKNRRAEFLIKP